MGAKSTKQKYVLTEEDLSRIACATRYTTEEIKKKFKDFILKNTNGIIEFTEFNHEMKREFPHMDSGFLHQLFAVFDENCDGMVDFKEYIIISYLMAKGCLEDRLRHIFRLFDIDRNGSIDRYVCKSLINFILYAIYI